MHHGTHMTIETILKREFARLESRYNLFGTARWIMSLHCYYLHLPDSNNGENIFTFIGFLDTIIYGKPLQILPNSLINFLSFLELIYYSLYVYIIQYNVYTAWLAFYPTLCLSLRIRYPEVRSSTSWSWLHDSWLKPAK